MSSSSSTAAMKSPYVAKFREGRPKSKNGCTTCKIRRVKCDETKPNCNRCTTTGRKCDGYDPLTPKKTKKRSNEKNQSQEESSLNLYNPSVDITGSTLERRSFHYFRSRNMAKLPGNFEPYLWDHLVLQFSHTDPAIRHSLIALSAIYESHERESRDSLTRADSLAVQSRSPYVLDQYNKAVQHLVTSISSNKQDPRATLISCLIFVWIEFLQNDLDSGLQHLKGGLKIMQDNGWSSNTTSDLSSVLRYDADDIYGSLSRSFTRLNIQAAIHGSPTSDFTTASTMPVFTKDSIPTCFSNIFESRNWLDNELNSIFGYLRKLRDVNQLTPENNHPFDLATLVGIRNMYLERLHQWGSATTSMAVSQPVTDELQTSGVIYLQMYYTLVTVILKTLFVETEMLFDEYTADFERILNLADTLIHDPRITTTPLLSFDMGVIPPLLFLVLKCRVLRLRKRAIVLLKVAPEQEGIWRRESVIKIAELKVKLEEEGRGRLSEGEPLPDCARIFQERVLYSKFWGKRVAKMHFKRGGGSQSLELTVELGVIEGMGDML